MKRTPEQAQAAVEEVKQMLKTDPQMTVETALKKMKLQPSTWYKYKGKRKPYTKKEPTVTEVVPLNLGSGRTMFVVTDDPQVIERILGRIL